MNGSHEPKSADTKLWGIKDVAQYLGISETSVYRMIERREIRFYRLARYIRFSAADVEAYLAERVVSPIK